MEQKKEFLMGVGGIGCCRSVYICQMSLDTWNDPNARLERHEEIVKQAVEIKGIYLAENPQAVIGKHSAYVQVDGRMYRIDFEQSCLEDEFGRSPGYFVFTDEEIKTALLAARADIEMSDSNIEMGHFFANEYDCKTVAELTEAINVNVNVHVHGDEYFAEVDRQNI